MVRIRETPEDFRVDEVPLYPAAGEGSHTFVRIEKRLRTSEAVARDLARAAGVRPRDVGYAGRKDRVAVTTQWFSVPELEPEAALGFELAGARVLEAVRHPHKLRTGQLLSNRFEIVVRDLEPAAFAAAQVRFTEMCRSGMPNRFGAQRFAAGEESLERARGLLAGGRVPRDRRTARFDISTLQAAVFNDVLAQRDELGVVEIGDVAVLHATGGVYRVEDLERDATRAARFEISPTGPIFGTRVLEPEGRVAECERAALRARGIELAELRAPRGIRLRGTRRALRVLPQDAQLEPIEGGAHLGFSLPSGSFATVLLEELFGALPA